MRDDYRYFTNEQLKELMSLGDLGKRAAHFIPKMQDQLRRQERFVRDGEDTDAYIKQINKDHKKRVGSLHRIIGELIEAAR